MAAKSHTEPPAEPWRSFLDGLDALLDQPTDFHCIGGFAISQYYGFGRETADLDVLSIAPQPLRAAIAAAAGQGSALHRKHRVFISGRRGQLSGQLRDSAPARLADMVETAALDSGTARPRADQAGAEQ